MKYLKEYYRRIVACVCVVAMLVSTLLSSPYLSVLAGENTASACAPIGVAFDSEEKVSGADFFQNNEGYTINSELIDNDPSGRKYVRINCTPDGGSLNLKYPNFLSQAGETSVDLDQYKYMKISYRHEIAEGGSPIGYEQMNIRANDENGNQKYWSVAYVDDLANDSDDEWKEIVFNFEEGTFSVYNEDDTVANSKADLYYSEAEWGFTAEKWSGKAYSFRIDPVLNTVDANTTMDIEYIALFATEDEALAYPNTPAKVQLETDLQNADFTANISQANTVQTAESLAGTKIQAVIDAQDTVAGSDATFTMNNSNIELNGTTGRFTSDVVITLPGQITFVYQLEMSLTGESAVPIKVIFDDAGTVQNANVEHPNYDMNQTYVTDTNSGRQYMHLECTPSNAGNSIYLRYHNFAEQSGVSPVTLANYPYMKISYRHEVVDGSTSDSANMHIKAMDANGGQTFWAKLPVADIRNNTPDGWKEIVADFTTSTFEVYNEDGTISQSNGLFDYNEGTYVWSNVTAHSFRIDFIEGGSAKTNMDIEYIALFATEAEALAYTPTLDQDMGTVANATFECDSEVVTTEAEALASLNTQIGELGLRNTFTIEDGVFTPTNNQTDGSYIATVVFNSTNKVSVTMKIVAEKPPIRVVFSDTQTVQNANVDHPNYDMNQTYVKDTISGKQYMHLECTPSNEGNSIYLRYHNFAEQSGVSPVALANYPYMKISYRHDVVEGSAYSDSNMHIKAMNESEDQIFWTKLPITDIQTDPDDEWKEIVVNFNTSTFDVYDEDHSVSQSQGVFNYNEGVYDWSQQTASSFRIDFIEGGSATINMDIEYIALFTTETEALAYTPTLDQDMETVTNATFECDSEVVTTEAEALASLTAQIDGLGLKCAYTIENASFTAASKTEDGSYIADIVFDDLNKVRVIMTIAKPLVDSNEELANMTKITLKDFGVAGGIYEKNTDGGFAFRGSYGESLDGTVFNVDIEFPSDNETRFEYGWAESWNCLRFRSIGDGRIILNNTFSGQDIITFTSDIADIASLVDTKFNLKLSLEYVDMDDDAETDDVKLGVWFNDKLYDNEYIYLENIALDLGQSIMLDMMSSQKPIVIGSVIEQGEVEQLPSGLTNITFKNFGIADGRYQKNTSEGYAFRSSYSKSLDGTLFSGDIIFPSDNETRFEYGWAESWHCLRFRSIGDGRIILNNTFSGEDVITFLSDVAGVSSLVDTEFNLKITLQYVDMDNDGAKDDVKLGVWFNDKLYDNKYIYLENIAPELGQSIMLDMMSSQKPVEISSVELEVILEQMPSGLKNITLKNFGITDGKYKYTAAASGKKGYEASGGYAFSLNNTCVSLDVEFSSVRGADLRFGGAADPWLGLRFDVMGDSIRMCDAAFSEEEGDKVYYFLSPLAGVQLLDNRFNLKLTTQFVDSDGDGAKDDVKLGVWFNDVLYNNEYIYLPNYALEMGGNLTICASKDVPESSIGVWSDKSVITGLDFTLFGFTKDWDKELGEEL